MVLNKANREALRRAMKNFFVKNPGCKKTEIVSHFVKQGIARRTIYNNINRLNNGQGIIEKRRTGRPSSLSKKKLKKLKRMAENKIGRSYRKLSSIFPVSKTQIRYNLRKMGVFYRKRMKTPKYNPTQCEKAKKNCRKLVNKLYSEDLDVIFDDEKYFSFSNDETPGNSGFHTSNVNECPDNVKFKGKEKFPKKILVWMAISERGMSEPLIRGSKSVSINQWIYLKECLKKRLLPFINNKHSDGKYIFWPDLASSHYANSCVTWMSENINFVQKEMNPPNVPQARPIENFWGDLTQKVYEDGWQAQTERQLKARIKKKLKEYDLTVLQKHFKALKKNLRKIADSGVLETFKS